RHMGLELVQQALPATWEILDRARADRGFGEGLQFLAWRLRRLAAGEELVWGRNPDADDQILEAACRKLLQEIPALPLLQVDLDRAWDLVQWVLSEDRRSNRPGQDLGSVAVRGESELARGVRASQGAPLMWTTPDKVLEISWFLDDFLKTDIDQLFDPKK